MMKQQGPFTSIGGQAILEGVMMRSPRFIAVAVRKPNGQIVIQYKPFIGLSQKYPLLKKPILRGVATLIESMIQGMNALSYSANVAAGPQSDGQELSSGAIVGSIVVALVLGMGLFVALPHFATVWLTSASTFQITAQSPIFHLLDGGLKMLILLSYVYLIAMMKDIHRVFQYHGAEHKSIYTFEAGEELSVENAKKFTTLHPRCGTSFLLFLVLISVIVFSIVFPLFHLTHFFTHPVLNHLSMIFIKMALMFPVAGLAYEFIKACAFRMSNPVFRILIWPGMILQKLTTREPEDDQLEVALASLRQVLRLEKACANQNSVSGSPEEIEITRLSDLTLSEARVAEFLEV